MLDLVPIFKNRRFSPEALLRYGFSRAENGFSLQTPLMDGQFYALLSFSQNGEPSFRVFETETNEEYFPARVLSAEGAFVGALHQEIELLFRKIAETCFPLAPFQGQAERVLSFLQTTLHAPPESLWEKFPDYAVFRVSEGGAWFALLANVARRSLALDGLGDESVLNVKAAPETVSALLQDGTALPAYHMNKKHWATLVLNDRLSDQTVFSLLEASFALVKG